MIGIYPKPYYDPCYGLWNVTGRVQCPNSGFAGFGEWGRQGRQKSVSDSRSGPRSLNSKPPKTLRSRNVTACLLSWYIRPAGVGSGTGLGMDRHPRGFGILARVWLLWPILLVRLDQGLGFRLGTAPK